MGVKSAKSGDVSFGGVTVTNVTDITISETANVKEYASSSSSGAVKRVAGHNDISGSFTMKDDDLATASIVKGTSAALIIRDDGALELYNGTAMITDIRYTVPIESGDIVEATIDWGQA